VPVLPVGAFHTMEGRGNQGRAIYDLSIVQPAPARHGVFVCLGGGNYMRTLQRIGAAVSDGLPVPHVQNAEPAISILNSRSAADLGVLPADRHAATKPRAVEGRIAGLDQIAKIRKRRFPR
jgi:hypothetical protein